MKSYTNLEQSKKLVEFLPIESADMTYCAITDGMREKMIIKNWEVNVGLDIAIKENLFSYRNGYMVPCWSLEALLGVIPYNVSFNRAVYRFKLVKFSDHWECYHENFGTVSTEIFKGDNPVDVCVAMIEKLHELNLL